MILAALIFLAGSIPFEWDPVDVDSFTLSVRMEETRVDGNKTGYRLKNLDDCKTHYVSIWANIGDRHSENLSSLDGFPQIRLRRVRLGDPISVAPRSRLVRFRGVNFALGARVEFDLPGVDVTIQSSTCWEIVALLILDDDVRDKRRYRVINPDGTYATRNFRFGRRWR